MKIPTLLFGAGPGACQYMENNALEREFIGFVDNDTAKHGQKYAELPVFAPHQLEELDFQHIVITTQWALEVQQQLINELGIAEHRVILPNKNQLKKATPFLHEPTRDLARRIIKSLGRCADEFDLPLIVDFGTLLGLVRDDDVIPWDDDIDFSVPVEFAAQTEKMLLAFKLQNSDGINWQVEKVVNNENEMVGLLLKFNEPELVSFTTSICFRQNRDGQSLHLPSLGMWFAPQAHFEQYDVIQWQECKLKAPFDHQAYLTFQYGDWKTPKKDMQLSDYANLNRVEFEDVKAAGFRAQSVDGSTE